MGVQRDVMLGVSAPTTSALIRPDRVKEESGIWMISATASAALTFSVSIQGRLSPEAPWYTIQTYTQADVTAGTGGEASIVVSLFPEMQVVLASIGGTDPLFSTWLME